MSTKAADKDHPYGHERFECVTAIVLAALLFVIGVGIGWAGIEKIITNEYGDFSVPGVLALFAAVLSIFVKEAMYLYTLAAAKKTGLVSLRADAWHHRSDALSSVGSFIGILFARLGFPMMDPLASVVISLFIIKVSYNVFKDASSKMVDKTCDDDMNSKISEVILDQEGVIGIDLLNTRQFGSKIYVEIEIAADASLTLIAAHDIAQRVHDEIEAKFEKVKHCIVHVNPYDYYSCTKQ
jgi:cation diffusion facilitator family transporter